MKPPNNGQFGAEGFVRYSEVHKSLQVLVYLAWMLSRDRNDINALNL